MVKIGQVLWLKIRFNNEGTVSSTEHPYLILQIETDNVTLLEVGQLDSLKPFKLVYTSNKPIYKDDPPETVISKDSYIQLDNKIQLEYYIGLEEFRRTEDTLSAEKLERILRAYEKYHAEHIIDPNKIVYLTKEELERLNPSAIGKTN